MNVTLWDVDKRSLLKRCREKEEEGYECISPITAVYSIKKDFHYQAGTRDKFDKRHFKGMSDLVRFRAIYKKEETA